MNLSDSGEDAAHEAAFQRHERAVRIQNAKIGALVSAITMLLGSSLDWVVYPEHLLDFLWVRLMTAVVAMGIFVGVCRYGESRLSEALAKLLPIVVILPIAWMIYASEGGQSSYYAGLNLIGVGLAIVLRWSAIFALLISIFTIAVYGLAIKLSPQEAQGEVIFNNFYFIVLTSGLVTAGSYFYEKVRRNEFSLLRQVGAQNVLLEENRDKLQELDEAKTRFFANVSHELRTPLTIMLGTAETLRERPVSDPQESYRVLHSNGLRLLSLIDNLLDLVRFEQGNEEAILRPTDPVIFLKGLVAGMMHLADRKQITVNFEQNGELPVLGLDEDKLEKVLLNLLINAVKFTSFGGHITLRASHTNSSLQLRVRDDGIGMSEEKQAQIFTRFWQADSSSNRKFRGSGIGLSLVKELVEVMKGEIEVRSAVGEGTEMKVTIPAQRLNFDAVPEESPRDPLAELHREAMLSLPDGLSEPVPALEKAPEDGEDRFRVLVADDEPDLRNFLVSELSREHEVAKAVDGAEAIEFIKQYTPDLVLLDYMMPDKNGIEVLAEIRASESLRHIPVIMLTARADEKIKLECLTLGATDFIAKPFALGELHLRVKNQIAMLAIRRRLRKKNAELEKAIVRIQENEVEMLRHEKLSSLGRMSAGIIHEINNPLNYVQGAHHVLGMHGRKLEPEHQAMFKDALKDAQEGVARVSEIVQNLRSFTKGDPTEMSEVDLIQVAQQAENLIGDQLRDFVKVTYEDLERIEAERTRLRIHGNASQLSQVLVNLFQNAIDAISERAKSASDLQGEISLSLRTFSDSDGEERIMLTFRDNGCGIPAELRPNIFDPFFTSKEVGDGMGLGLSIVHQIIERHHGRVSIESEEGLFTEIHLNFPIFKD